jgi:hypothetical protein
VDYAKLLEMNSFFTWHIFLQVGKTQDLPSKIWQTLGVALRGHHDLHNTSSEHDSRIMSPLLVLLAFDSLFLDLP